jgi:nucleoid-associated protein YgaU
LGGRRFAIIAVVSLAIAGCAAETPLWRDEAYQELFRARKEGADRLLPAEFKSVEAGLLDGETALRDDGVEESEPLFHFAYLRARQLEADVAAERKRRDAEEAKRREAERKELEREEERRRSLEEAARKARLEAPAARAVPRRGERPRPVPERPLPSHHTVKRGETLPQIAALADVYNDASLWPLLYRANRDQISNPRHIWPGQVLRIPRSLGREDFLEARRYAREKPLY